MNLRDEAIAARELILALQMLGNLDAEAVEISLDSETDVREAFEAALAARDEAEMLAAAIKARIDDMDIRRQRLLQRVETIEGEIEAAMDLLPREALPLRLPAATLSMSSTGAKVIVTDEGEIPDEWCEIETKRRPKKAEIGKALRGGAAIPGATLSNKTRTLRISRG